MVVSPALGAYLMERWSVSLVVTLATAVAILDVFFILVAVPESLPEKVRPTSTWGSPISWEQADPFAVSISDPTLIERTFYFPKYRLNNAEYTVTSYDVNRDE